MEKFCIYKLSIILLYVLNHSFILSYIKFPVYTYHSAAPKANETLTKIYYNYFHDNSIYTILEIGSPSQKVVANLNFDDYPFYIYYNRCVIESNFDINISKSYIKAPFQRLLTDIYVFTFLINETFHLPNKETPIMTYLFSALDYDKSEKTIVRFPYTCAGIGLKIPRADMKSYNYNFIRQLKLSNIIKDYTFFFEYNQDNDDKGELILGVEPHNYNPNKYKFDKMISIESVQIDFDLYWQLSMNEIYFNLKNENNESTQINTTSLNVGLNHNLNIIIAPVEFYYIIEKEFFKKKKCKENYLANNFINFDCGSLEDIKEFPTIYFLHRILRYTFEITYKDVFVEYNGRYMCKIWIDMSYRKNWRMGKPFLKKYFFSFNPDKKVIGFYLLENNNDKNEKNKDEQVNKLEIVYIIVIIILLLATIGLSYVLTRIFFRNKKPKIKAKLLQDSDAMPITDEN